VGAVRIDGLVIEYRQGDAAVRPLDGFDMAVEAGQLALLLGPSGCGKSSLLSCLAGIQRPTAGSIRVGDHVVTELDPKGLTGYRRHGVGVVFQAFNLVPSLTALENVALPVRSAGGSVRAARERAAELLADVGLADRAHHRPGALSGGQMQRVAIARALALDPPVVLADEPTANLDHVQVESVLRILRGLTERGRSVVVATHDSRLLPLADVVVDLGPGETGHLVPVVSLELAPGEVLFAEGAAGDRIYRVESGSVELRRDGARLGASGPGEVFGEMAPVFQLRRSASAVAAEPTVLTGYTVDAFMAEFGGDELRRLVGRVVGGLPPGQGSQQPAE